MDRARLLAAMLLFMSQVQHVTDLYGFLAVVAALPLAFVGVTVVGGWLFVVGQVLLWRLSNRPGQDGPRLALEPPPAAGGHAVRGRLHFTGTMRRWAGRADWGLVDDAEIPDFRFEAEGEPVELAASEWILDVPVGRPRALIAPPPLPPQLARLAEGFVHSGDLVELVGTLEERLEPAGYRDHRVCRRLVGPVRIRKV